MPKKVEESVPKPYYTADMVRALPADGNKYELVYGELLVTPAPRLLHEIVVARLTFALTQYMQSYPIGFVFGVPGDITWGRKDVLVQPDVFVAPLEEVRTLDWEEIRGLMLVAEVLSPSSAQSDRFTKRKRYQDALVPLYWVVDADRRSVEIWTPDDPFPRVEMERLIWHPKGVDEPFALDLKELLRPV
jgi:Uma2 family endonuclease